jgi:hypothetical protein
MIDFLLMDDFRTNCDAHGFGHKQPLMSGILTDAGTIKIVVLAIA